MKNIKFNNSIEMPMIGFGTYKITDKEELKTSLKNAINAGYRKIDTAQVYQNEHLIGEALKEIDIDRKELFITTKIWNTKQGYNSTRESFEESLKKLDMEYVDLLLIHWPGQDTERCIETWRALEHIYQSKKARSIGLSNFEIPHLKNIFAHCTIAPVLNQLEIHPLLTQKELIQYCREHHIVVEAWSPIARNKLADNEILIKIAKKYNKTVNQIILRWHLENDLVSIPKSSNKERIEENINIFDFSLEKEEISQIDSLNINERIGPNPFDFF